MIVYLETKSKFREDILSNRIETKVLERFERVHGRAVGRSELLSWQNSLPFMERVLGDDEIPGDTGVAIEFSVPNTGKRIDFILTGTAHDGQRQAVIIELKQWETVTVTEKDAIVRTFIGGQEREVSHPSYQAWSYAMLIEDFNESVREIPIHLRPCAYLHNCESTEVVRAHHYSVYTTQAPAFLKDDAIELRNFIKKYVKHGDQGETLYRIRDGRISPSKSLADHLASLLQGNREFYLIDDQKLVYETALYLARKSSPAQKNVLIVNGGPGTGKSVVAVNLLVELNQMGLATQYVTKNSAPRAVYESKLTGTMTKTRISNLFVGSGTYTESQANEFGALVVDEAHRLNEKSGMFQNLGENQIKEVIHAAPFSVFFLDEDQQIHWKDIGSGAEILRWAAQLGATVTELALESQFRCNGSDGYLAWVDGALQIRPTANPTLEGAKYEFHVCDSAAELRDLIYARNRINNRARMVAGYCWDWVTKKSANAGFDIGFLNPPFEAKWNLTKDGSLWILSPDSVSEVGCIHTCQGLEVDYIGVIIGPDLVVRDGEVKTNPASRSRMDKTMSGFKADLKRNRQAALDKADRIIRNTYRTLLTRGLKGCYLFCTDAETNAYFKEASIGALPVDLTSLLPEPQPQPASSSCPLRIISAEEAAGATNVVPLFQPKIAAGEFSPEQWLTECEFVELPDHFSAKPGLFVAQVCGESMNRRIPNGSWCLFREPPAGTRDGKVVLVQSRSIQDHDNGGQFTVKIYRSEKVASEELWSHRVIRLEPDSFDSRFKAMVLTGDAQTELRVVGEFVAVVS